MFTLNYWVKGVLWSAGLKVVSLGEKVVSGAEGGLAWREGGRQGRCLLTQKVGSGEFIPLRLYLGLILTLLYLFGYIYLVIW